MICKMCATAADMQSRANEIREEKQAITEMSEALTYNGTKLHNECKGCDCQHGIVRRV